MYLVYGWGYLTINIVLQLCSSLFLSNMKFSEMRSINRRRFKKHGKDKDGWNPLLNNMVQHTDTTNGGQIFNTERTQQYPDLISTELVNGEKALNVLKKTVNAHSTPQDIHTAAVMMKKWGEQNGVTVDKKEGSYPQDWLCEFQQLIDKHVEQHFPILPVESTTTQRCEQIEEFLKSTENVMLNEVHRLSPVLKDAGLLSYLIQSYNRHLFTKLDLLVNKDLSVNETFCLLQWGKRVFFSPDSQDVFSDCDPLLISGWFEKAKQKLLTILKDETSSVLQNILNYEEEHKETSMDEEWFIRVHFDVTQCLISSIQRAKKFSQTLMHMVQILCLGELHSFVQKYVHVKKQHLKNLKHPMANSIHLFRIISTCMKLRCLAGQIATQNKSKDFLNTVDMLKKLEDHALSIVNKKIKHTAQVSLRSYFEKGNECIYKLTEEIEKQCESLPQTHAAEEIRTIIVNLAYDCVSHVYLNCMINTKFKRLQKRWEDVEEVIRQDVQNFHNTFTQLNVDVEQNQLLVRMSEVLFTHDVETLKLTCGILFKDFPEDSDLYLPRLLRWKRTLSEQQVREILEVGRVGCQNPKKCSHPLMGLCCLGP
ncbi:exocyst complex component 3 [Paramisgurnus dabryanus]|uniref:exocyst complex component 3 n=1 Tax=Paramisgurnus dabryanus TaxID=90735 RepID=UPI0031F3402D